MRGEIGAMHLATSELAIPMLFNQPFDLVHFYPLQTLGRAERPISPSRDLPGGRRPKIRR